MTLSNLPSNISQRMHRLEWILAISAALLGASHLGFTAVLFRHPSIDALWFAGAGLSIVGAALMNIVALRAGDRSSPTILFATNAVMACFSAAAWSLTTAPQTAIAFALFAGLALCTFLKLLAALGKRSLRSS